MFGACGGAVLGVAAVGDAAGGHEGAEALFGDFAACGVDVEHAGLADGGGSDEFGAGVYLRAGVEAAAACHAAGEGVGGLLFVLGHLRAGADVVGAVEGDPGFDFLEGFKHGTAVDEEVADNGEFQEGLEGDGGLQLRDEGGAGLPGAAVDSHAARAADFFKA